MPDIERVVPKLDSILAGINILTTDPALGHSLHNVEAITSNLATTTASLNTLIAELNTNVPGMMSKAGLALDKANTTLDNTSKLTANLAAIDVEGTMSKVNQTLANVQDVTTRLNTNEGTLGLLMNDATLYNNLNSTMVSADSLLTDLKAHPKRYVHFSLFGRKSK
jgi:phospholipid/cholesterol/gamma-HCH transport system substrate-binding protein